MKKFYILCSLIALLTSVGAQDISQKLDNYLSRRRTFNGSALVVYKNNILLYKGFGYKNARLKTPNDTATIYRIGSVTKPFTAAMILYLEQKKLLKLNDHLSLYIPGFPNGEDITIEQLLTHSSGIKDYLEVKSVQELPDSAPPVSMDKLISYFKDERPTIKPGRKFSIPIRIIFYLPVS